ncbi:MAG TPA: M1 family aminopeptidase [Gemmatimonadaceae bacterium]
MKARFVVPLLLLAACSRTARPVPPLKPEPSVPPVVPVQPEPAAESALAIVPDTMASYRVPAFGALPIVQWGPPPEGKPHAPRARTYDLQHQVIHVRFDWDRHAVEGTTTLTLAALDTAITSVALDAVGMTFEKVADARDRALRHDYDGRTLTVHLPTPLAPHARTSITLDYESVHPKKGAYFVDRRHVLWTQGEMIDTRYWIPTYDEPNDKTTWEMYIRTAKGERALSNGKLVGSRTVGSEVEWHWKLEKPASTYLMTAVTGNYTVLQDKWRDVPVGYWTYPDSVKAAWRGFAITPRAVRVFSEKTGVKYPWVKYDQIVAPDYIFGGMENVTATTQADDGILHPAWAEPQANADGLVAHELGHQWYGDLLTTESWADAWLNEGFATFMEQTYRETARGKDEGAIDRLGAQQQTIAADARTRRPLVWSRWKVDPLELFLSGHIYPRGASVLQMLRHQLGDSLFWAAMHRYTTKHAYGNVTSADLRDAFEAETGRDFRRFFDQWVYGAGVPQFRVTYAYDSASGKLTLHSQQTQPVDSMTGIFDVNVDVKVLTDEGAVRGVMQVHGKESTLTLALPAPPRAIRWNDGGWILEAHDFPRPTVMLRYQLQHDDDVIGRLEAVSLLSERPAERIAASTVADAARADAFWAVREAAAAALQKFAIGSSVARADSASGAATSAGGASTLARATRFQDSVATVALLAASADSDARVRESAAGSLSAFPGDSVEARLRELARSDSSLFVRGAALVSYARIAPSEAVAVIRETLQRDSWLDIERTSAVQALQYVDTPEAWNMLLPYLAFSVDRHTRQSAIASLTAKAMKDGRRADAAAAIEPVLGAPDFYSRASAAQALGTLGRESSLAALEARLKVEAESRVINAIDAAAKEIRKQ